MEKTSKIMTSKTKMRNTGRYSTADTTIFAYRGYECWAAGARLWYIARDGQIVTAAHRREGAKAKIDQMVDQVK
jgi:hypothetical protein